MYQHRHCEYCHQQGVLGDETHIFLRCPATASLIGETVAQINKKLRLFDVLPWSSFTDTQRVSILLGNPPPPSSKNTRRGGCRSVSPYSTHTFRSFGPSSSPYYPHLLRSLNVTMTLPTMPPKHRNPHHAERIERHWRAECGDFLRSGEGQRESFDLANNPHWRAENPQTPDSLRSAHAHEHANKHTTRARTRTSTHEHTPILVHTSIKLYTT